MLIHASSVAIDHRAVLLTGPAGAGKSDVTLRLIDAGATLIADDQTLLTRSDDVLMASAPESLKGLIEVRHVGLLRVPHAGETPVALTVELVELDESLERLPEENFATLLDIRIRLLHLPAFAASTPAKIRAALKYPEAK
jgi:HPr kinase/phosphorylase